MPLNGEEHTRAQDDNFECTEDYNKPIHNYFFRPSDYFKRLFYDYTPTEL